MGAELVSVVIPAYRAEAFIADAIRSVHAQTWRPCEVVVVDDCSPDDSAAVAESIGRELADASFGVSVVRRDRNGGVTEAIRAGFDAAEGRYVCWLSADDLYTDPRKLEEQVRVMNSAGLAYATSFTQGSAIDTAELIRNHWSPRFASLVDKMFNRRGSWRVLGFMFANPVHGSTVMMPAGLLEEYADFDVLEGTGHNYDSDGDLWLRLSALGVPFGTTSAPALFSRQHEGQASQKHFDDWRIDCEIVRMRVLYAYADAGRMAELLARAWPVLVLGLRRRYRTFPYARMAICLLGDRVGMPFHIRYPVRAMRQRMQDLGLWNEERYEELERSARASMRSEEFRRFVARLATAPQGRVRWCDGHVAGRL